MERLLMALFEKIANSAQDESKLKKLVICPILNEMNPTLLAKAVTKLETLCFLASRISPLQENTIYKHIVQSEQKRF